MTQDKTPSNAPLDSLELLKVVMQADEETSAFALRGTTNWAAYIGKAVQRAVIAAALQPAPATQQAGVLSDKHIKEHGDKASRMMARDLTRFDAACEVDKYLREQGAPYYYRHRMSIVLFGNTEGTDAARAPDNAPQPSPTAQAAESVGRDADRIVKWSDRIQRAHPRSEPEFWPDALRVKYMADEISDLRAARDPADSVLEDAARLDWLDQQCEAYGFQDIHEGNRWEISGAYANVRVAIDAERAGRKQGGT